MNQQLPAANIVKSESTSVSMASRIGWTVLICATLYVCYFSHLGAIGFVGPDEPRYAWIARAMVETGDWVTPRLYGRPWFEKPVLYYWEAAACFKLFGVSEAAARLPSAISALLATLAMAWLAWRTYGAEVARWFLLLLPTSVGMIGFSHAAATDMPFSGMLTVALVCAAAILGLVPARGEVAGTIAIAGGASPAPTASFVEAKARKRNDNSWLWLLLFGFFLGLAVLAKGPAAIVLMGGAVFLLVLFTKRWRSAFRLLHAVAIAAFCATALPWYILCARRNPDFLRVFIIEHNFKRYLTPEFQHIQPFWYYGVVLLIAFLPWTVVFVWATVSGAIRLWRTPCTSDITWLLICWSAFSVLFFSVSKSKLPGYILPAIPAIALLCAQALAVVRWTRALRLSLYAVSFASLSFGTLFGNLTVHIGHIPPLEQRLAGVFLVFVALCGFLLGSGVAADKSPVRTAIKTAAFLAVVIVLAFGGSHLLNVLDQSFTTRAIATETRSILKGSPVFARALNRSDMYGLSFYLGEELLEKNMSNSRDAYVVTTFAGARDLQKGGLKLSLISFQARPISGQALVACRIKTSQ